MLYVKEPVFTIFDAIVSLIPKEYEERMTFTVPTAPTVDHSTVPVLPALHDDVDTGEAIEIEIPTGGLSIANTAENPTRGVTPSVRTSANRMRYFFPVAISFDTIQL